MIILQCIPPPFTINYIYGHRDNNTEINKLSTHDKLNIDADHITTTTVTIITNTHFISLPFAVVVNNIYINIYIYIYTYIYIYNKIDHHVRQKYHAD